MPDSKLIPDPILSSKPSGTPSDFGSNAFLPLPMDRQHFNAQKQGGLRPQDAFNVLIVENDRLTSERLLKTFRAHGYLAETAFTYQEGLARVGQAAFDIAVLDDSLPDGQGDRLMKALQDKTPDCVCLMITANPQPEPVLAWMKSGAVGYLQKPFEPEYLIIQCERALRERTLRQQSQEALRESAQLLQTVIDHSQYLVYAKDLEGRFILASQSLAEFFGQPSYKQLIGKTSHDFLPKATADQHRMNDLEVLAQQNLLRVEETVETQHGCLTFLSSKFPLRDKNGIVYAVCGASVDVTEHKQVGKALQVKSQALDAALNAIAFSDLDGLLTYVNPAFLRMWGYTNDGEVIGKNVLGFWQIEEKAAEVVKALQETGGWTGQMTARHKDGPTFIVQVSTSMVVDETGQPICRQASFEDITARVQAQEAMRSSEERYHLIDEASQDLIYSYDRQGRFTHANHSLCKQLGLTPDQIIGKTHEELGFPQAQCLEWARFHQQVYETNATVIKETITSIQGKDPQYFEVVLNPIHDETGAITGIAGTTRDINARKLAEARINAQLAELRRWQAVTMGREDRILELKSEVNRLLVEAGKPPRYTSAA